MNPLRKLRPVALLVISFFALAAISACAFGGARAYDPALYAIPIPDLPGPLCTDATTAKLGTSECDARRSVFVKRAMKMTVRILPPTDGSDGDGQKIGTGVFITTNGDCLTANHVVAGSKYALVTFRAVAGGGVGLQFHDAGSVMMEVVRRDRKNDLALLRPVDGKKLSVGLYAELGLGNDFGYGSKLWHFGTVTLARAGKMFAVDPSGLTSGLKDIHPLYALEATVAEGDSGAPVFAPNGKLVGILLGGADPVVGKPTYQHGLFVPIDTIRAFVPEAIAPVPATLEKGTGSGSLSPPSP